MSDLDFDPNLFQPEILARLPIEVKIALVDLTRASVEAASLTKGNKHPVTAASPRRTVRSGRQGGACVRTCAPEGGRPMKALSFSQPWLWAVLYGNKRVENRKWAPPINMIDQRIALHAAKSWDKDGVPFLTKMGLADKMPGRFDLYAKSAIVGVATIDRVITDPKSLPEDQRGWFFGPVGWILSNVIPLEQPLAATGALQLWPVPEVLESQINAQLGGR